MNLRQIEVFRSVMLTGSIIGASKLLNVTPPGVSRTIKHLQISIGVLLFDRCRGRLVPTDEARTLHGEIERVYRGIESVQHLAQMLKTGVGSRLRVLACPGSSLRAVPNTIGRVRQGHRGLQVQFHVMTADCMRDMLVSQQADVGVCLEHIDHPSLQTEALGKLRMVAVVATGHRLASRRTLCLADIRDEEWISFGMNLAEGRAIQRVFEAQGCVPVPRSAVEVQTGRSACSLVEAGVGLTLVDELTAKSMTLRNAVIVPVSADEMFTVWAIRNSSVPLSAVTRKFLDLLRKEVAMLLGSPPSGTGVPHDGAQSLQRLRHRGRAVEVVAFAGTK